MNRITILFIIWSFSLSAQECYFSGWIKDAITKENIVDAIITLENTSIYEVSNQNGYFSLLTKQTHDSSRLKITAIGYEPLIMNHLCKVKDTIIFLKKDKIKQFEEVTVSASKNHQIGSINISIDELKKIPMLGGEADIIRALQLLPGIQGGKEGTSGLFVRGGTPDQNLFLLDNVPLYNVNHIGGFLSTFDPNSINNIQVYKGNFPARYSGRLSSVVDLSLKNGNQSKKTGEIQVGLLTTKLQIEGPLGKDSSWTYLASVRRFNIDIFTRIISRIESNGESKAGYTFFDSNLKLVKRFKNHSTLSFGYYGGRDRIFVNSKSDYGTPYRFISNVKWGNFMGFVQYNRSLNEKTTYSANLAISHFFYNSGSRIEDLNTESYELESKIRFDSKILDVLLKQNVLYKINPYWSIVGGWNTTIHTYLPGRMSSQNKNKDTIIGNAKIRAWENNLYIENQIKIHTKLRINAGFNLTGFSIKDTTFFSPEPRVLVDYSVNKHVNIQVGYTRMKQFIHYLSNSGAGLPSDIWIPATKEMVPESSNQFNAGIIFPELFRKFPLDVSIEGYYKQLNNLIEYKEGSSMLVAQNLSSKVETNGIGYVYGIEFLIKRNVGKVTGWIGYTYSKNNRKFETMNNGNWFPFKFDRTHDISVVMNYSINKSIDISATWVYMTGNTFTLANGKYEYLEQSGYYMHTNYDPTDNSAHIYNGKNNVRLPSYHRLDVGVNFTKEKQKGTRIWSLSVYNLYNQQNAFFFFYKKNNQNEISLHQITIFPILPTLTYRFLF